MIVKGRGLWKKGGGRGWHVMIAVARPPRHGGRAPLLRDPERPVEVAFTLVSTRSGG